VDSSEQLVWLNQMHNQPLKSDIFHLVLSQAEYFDKPKRDKNKQINGF